MPSRPAHILLQPTKEQWDEAIAASGRSGCSEKRKIREGEHNEFYFDRQVRKDSRANRDGYVEAMLEMMAENPKLVHIDCDLMGCINTESC